MAFPEYTKDPQAILDYEIDWSTWLDTDTIVDSSWSAQTGITIVTDSNDTNSTKVWLSGGTVGDRYNVTNEIVTTQGRTDDRTITIIVEQK
jgi:hypothetical protein